MAEIRELAIGVLFTRAPLGTGATANTIESVCRELVEEMIN